MLIPIWREVPFDLETSVAAFAKLRRGPFSFLLESAPAGSETWSRFTYLGTEPRAAWRLSDGVVHDWTPDRGWHAERRPRDPLADLEAVLATHPAAVDRELSNACGGFWGGAVGYFGYDVVRYIERLPNAPRQALDVPDALFVLTRVLWGRRAALEALESQLHQQRGALLAQINAVLDAGDYHQAAQDVRQLMFLEKFGEEVSFAFEASEV